MNNNNKQQTATESNFADLLKLIQAIYNLVERTEFWTGYTRGPDGWNTERKSAILGDLKRLRSSVNSTQISLSSTAKSDLENENSLLKQENQKLVKRVTDLERMLERLSLVENAVVQGNRLTIAIDLTRLNEQSSVGSSNNPVGEASSRHQDEQEQDEDEEEKQDDTPAQDA